MFQDPNVDILHWQVGGSCHKHEAVKGTGRFAAKVPTVITVYKGVGGDLWGVTV